MLILEPDQLAVAAGCEKMIKEGIHLVEPCIKIGGI